MKKFVICLGLVLIIMIYSINIVRAAIQGATLQSSTIQGSPSVAETFFILQNDGSSKLLQNDGSSFLLLAP